MQEAASVADAETTEVEVLPTTSMTIAKTCVGVRFKCAGVAEKKKSDKQSTADLVALKNMKAGVADVVLRLGNPPELRKLKAVRTNADATYKEYTAPFGDDKVRIIARQMLYEFEEKMGKFEKEFIEARNAYVKAYSRIKREFEEKRGDSTVEFPSEAEFAESVQWQLEVDLLPNVESSLYSQLDETLQRRMVKNILKQQADATRGTLYHIVDSLTESVQDFRDKMKEYRRNSDGKVENRFRKETFTNLKRQCSIAHSLNIDKDPKLTAAIDKIEHDLADADPEDLRQHPEYGKDQPLRAEKVQQSDEVLKNLDIVRGKI